MFGVDYEATLVSRTSGEGTWGVGFLPGLGLAIPTADEASGNALALTAGLPLTYTAGRDWRLTAHFTPSFGYGRVADDDVTESGTRTMIGFGLTARSPGGFGLLAGFQKILLEGSEPVIGFGATFGRPAGRP
jgi:hypothetical protein